MGQQLLVYFLSIIMLIGISTKDADAYYDYVTNLSLDRSVLNNQEMEFISRESSGAMAMNIRYSPVVALRKQIILARGHGLKIFDGWDENGEAHVTVITPPEFNNIIRKYIPMKRIEAIALRHSIQSSELQVLGLGKGSALVDGQKQLTYFIIVDAPNLIKIRREIYKEFIQQGGPAASWDPDHFYPHITIGFTSRDLHESDGVFKDVSHCLDPAFNLLVE
ncbi:MAG: hypothetical protein A2504_05890 [Bdellovibrionales bacterium RIFOXYD12_FULL_39_22]|nr:MAG: hypothetical protein A2385_05935 [Bdellovibrionales bacterium RIFOXYB1_FULL_39_21]OFZ41819.1 MAG: hypothetical protein A2485_07905 [Bdellovibrionales bacterium RIFOXYC12_FULL_39_17]OFZ50535.1 MAG: hypothetical protein A2404_04855 [Bdellovibrionales bacterium RIFOXYC1_FULL_39_130]OFZ71798.1 MAG: hypothetical protein A2451_07090 [Bdellovibrionales bacterium RIFOXYC2_FULL_39_8]OFZ77758.1 MAG: hypothetical protein A2560_00025 [Bdellovibrionales bacterium RIFOXYD1_FULL_39_84]OFZ93806.1 MAG: